MNFNMANMPKMRKVLSSLRENHKYIREHPYNQNQNNGRFNSLASPGKKSYNPDYQGGFKMNTTMDTQATFSPP